MTRISLLPPALALLAFLWLLPAPPALVLLVAGLLLPFVARERDRHWLLLGAPLLALLLIWRLPDGVVYSGHFLDYPLDWVKGSAAGRLFATLFTVMAFLTALFGLHQARRLEQVAILLYAGSAVGVVLAGDWLTLFVYWELMLLGSTLLLWASGTPAAYRASRRYVAIHLFGGVLLLSGIVAQAAATGSLSIQPLLPNSVGTVLILLGFLINAGAPPLSAWIADAYPEASPSGMVLLASVTTKTAIYALLVVFPGLELLVPVGLYMVVYGALYALLENDLRRMLAYTLVNQLGFMVTVIGVGTPLALNGAVALAVCNTVGLLVMAAGSVLHATGQRKLSGLGGLATAMPVTLACTVWGALALAAFPLTSGFIAKSLISQSLLETHQPLAWFLLVGAAAAVTLHAGLKFIWFVFFDREAHITASDPPWNRRAALLLFAGISLVIGGYPPLLYDRLPFPVQYVPYTAAHVVTQGQLMLFAALAFFLLLPQLRQTATITLDFDWFYRRFGVALAGKFVATGQQLRERLERVFWWHVELLIRWLFIHHGPKGWLASTWPTGSMVLWVAVLLGACLIFYYV